MMKREHVEEDVYIAYFPLASFYAGENWLCLQNRVGSEGVHDEWLESFYDFMF